MSKPSTVIPTPNDNEPEIVRTARKFDVSVESMRVARAIGDVTLAHKQCGLCETIDALGLVLKYYVDVDEMRKGSRPTWH